MNRKNMTLGIAGVLALAILVPMEAEAQLTNTQRIAEIHDTTDDIKKIVKDLPTPANIQDAIRSALGENFTSVIQDLREGLGADLAYLRAAADADAELTKDHVDATVEFQLGVIAELVGLKVQVDELNDAIDELGNDGAGTDLLSLQIEDNALAIDSINRKLVSILNNQYEIINGMAALQLEFAKHVTVPTTTPVPQPTQTPTTTPSPAPTPAAPAPVEPAAPLTPRGVSDIPENGAAIWTITAGDIRDGTAYENTPFVKLMDTVALTCNTDVHLKKAYVTINSTSCTTCGHGTSYVFVNDHSGKGAEYVSDTLFGQELWTTFFPLGTNTVQAGNPPLNYPANIHSKIPYGESRTYDAHFLDPTKYTEGALGANPSLTDDDPLMTLTVEYSGFTDTKCVFRGASNSITVSGDATDQKLTYGVQVDKADANVPLKDYSDTVTCGKAIQITDIVVGTVDKWQLASFADMSITTSADTYTFKFNTTSDVPQLVNLNTVLPLTVDKNGLTISGTIPTENLLVELRYKADPNTTCVATPLAAYQ